MILVVYMNFSMLYEPKFEQENEATYNYSVYTQMRFLKTKMHDGAGPDMQKLYPEGFIFLNALYALGWSDLIRSLPKDSKIYKEGITELTWAFNQINSEQGKDIFDRRMPLKYGAYYMGWSNIVLANLVELKPDGFGRGYYDSLYKDNCVEIQRAIQNSSTPFLESYDQHSWPADMVMVVASLNKYDQIFRKKYRSTIDLWLIDVKARLDTTYGLIPHKSDWRTGNTEIEPRGSSQSLMLNFLIDIDRNFAEEQFKIYKEKFLDSRLGLPGVREYPKGSIGLGDVDSGPVIWGIGGAASIVGQRTMYKYGAYDAYEGLRNSIEGFGAAYTWSDRKRYVFGLLAMADAFIAWSNSIEKEPMTMERPRGWKWKFHIGSLILLVGLFFWIRKPKVKEIQRNP